jgi:hypothetical protein
MLLLVATFQASNTAATPVLFVSLAALTDEIIVIAQRTYDQVTPHEHSVTRRRSRHAHGRLAHV